MADEDNKSLQIGFRATEEEKTAIEAAAKKEDRSVSNFVRKIVFDYIKLKDGVKQ